MARNKKDEHEIGENDFYEFEDTRQTNEWGSQARGAGMSTIIAGKSSLAQTQQFMATAGLSPEERFKQTVLILCEMPEIKLNDRTKVFLSGKIDAIPDVKYLNPVAFVLGYIVIKDKDISEQEFERVKVILNEKQIQEYGVKEEDVIRYARYWLIRIGLNK